ncbi:hypothetical protein ACLB2K_009988 [Fragaria x ananassa]
MADEAQYSSGPDSGGNKRKYEEPTTRRVTGFSAPILPSSSPESVPTSYSSVPPPVDDIQLAKQRAQEIAARLYNNASSGVAAAAGLETKRPRVDNGGGYDSGDRGFSSIPSDAKPYSAPSSIPVSYGFQGGSKKIAVPNGRVGVIIGKQGETIKYLQAQSGGAKIQVTRDADADLNCPTREVEIMGTPEQISKAEHLINEVLAEAESGAPAVVSRRSTGQAGAETFVMKIPNNKVGLVIGKRGETIKNMQASTAARIQVIPLHLPPGDTSIERTVQIDGTSEQIEAAKQLVNEVISENRARNPAMGGGYSQQGYQTRPPTGWAPSGPPMQQPGYGYGQSGAYSGATPQYNASQPSYPGYPPQPASGGYPTNWDQSAAAPTQQTSQGGSYDYYSQQPSHQQQNPGGSAAPADNASYNYGQPPISGYNQQGQGYSQDGYGGYQAPPQSGYGQPPAYDQHGYPAANYGNVSNPAPDTSSYGSQGESAQAPPVQPAPGGQQAYTANQQPSPNPASYPPQVPSQPGYGMPPTSQTGYGTQPPAQSAYGPGYGAPPQAQKPPAQSPTTPGSYGQPPAVHPGYPHSQPPPSGYAQPDSGARVPPSSYGSTAAQAGYGGPPAYGAPPSGQPGYGQAPPYNTSYGAAGYTQPPAYSAEGANGNTRGGAYDAAGAGAPPASQTAQPSGVAKTSPQS